MGGNICFRGPHGVRGAITSPNGKIRGSQHEPHLLARALPFWAALSKIETMQTSLLEYTSAASRSNRPLRIKPTLLHYPRARRGSYSHMAGRGATIVNGLRLPYQTIVPFCNRLTYPSTVPSKHTRQAPTLTVYRTPELPFYMYLYLKVALGTLTASRHGTQRKTSTPAAAAPQPLNEHYTTYNTACGRQIHSTPCAHR